MLRLDDGEQMVLEQRVVARVCERAASDAMLNAAGVMELQARL